MLFSRLWTILSVLLISACVHLPASAVQASREVVAHTEAGEPIEAITLTNTSGVSVTVLSFGATLQKFYAPDRDGQLADILVGYDDAKSFETGPNYFGVTVGRYANRIAGGRFTLDGETYQLPLNDGVNTLHGGGGAFDVRNWTIESLESGPQAHVTLSLNSEDGDNGYPGALNVHVTYSLDETGALTIEFDASTDKPTVVNMTNHAIFDLAGNGAPQGAMLHELTIPASHYTPVDDSLIPTGELRAVDGTVFDFRAPRRIADGLRDGKDAQIRIGRGYDHNFALDKGLTETPELAAHLRDPQSGRALDVLTTEPGLQVYTGNFLDGTVTGKGDTVYRMGDGIALEPQKFPDAPNQPDFISARIDPGAPYRHVMVYRVSVEP
jgi:aldose 1-epimerase